jgi:hypothetical protein
MLESPDQHLISVFRKFRPFAASGLISPQEYINKLFDTFSSIDQVYPELIPSLWELVPQNVRDEFAAEVRRASLSGFRWHPFYIGGSRPMTEEELRQDEELLTARVRAWAVEFVLFLEGESAKHE